MFDHVTIRVSDRAASERFYETGLRVLGTEPTHPGDDFVEWDDFSLLAGPPVRPGAPSSRWPASDAAVDAFHAALTGAGYRDNGSPGERPQYHEGYYAAFVLDPDGSNVELVNHNR